jgi:hypothetical protein
MPCLWRDCLGMDETGQREARDALHPERPPNASTLLSMQHSCGRLRDLIDVGKWLRAAARAISYHPRPEN